jgi:hypothetical protein
MVSRVTLHTSGTSPQALFTSLRSHPTHSWRLGLAMAHGIASRTGALTDVLARAPFTYTSHGHHHHRMQSSHSPASASLCSLLVPLRAIVNPHSCHSGRIPMTATPGECLSSRRLCVFRFRTIQLP